MTHTTRRTVRQMMTGIGFAMAAALLGTSCADRLHIGGPSYGRAYETAFQRQAVNPGAGRSGRGLTHLDSQDAAVIARSYRKGMSKDDGARDQGMLQYAPHQAAAAAAGAYYMPPPSVPEGR